jgi:hypothetical protein
VCTRVPILYYHYIIYIHVVIIDRPVDASEVDFPEFYLLRWMVCYIVNKYNHISYQLKNFLLFLTIKKRKITTSLLFTTNILLDIYLLPHLGYGPVTERDDLCSNDVWQSANMINDFSPANF